MPIMNMACSNAVKVGFAAVGKPDTWSMPFLLRATPRLDLAGWTLRSEVNHHGDRAFERHTRPDPERYEHRNVLASDPLSGQYALVLVGEEQVLTIRVVGDYRSAIASRLAELATFNPNISVVMHPAAQAQPNCQFMVGVGLPTEAQLSTADVWLDHIDRVDELWRDRLVPFDENLRAGRRARRNQRVVHSDPDSTWPMQAQRLIQRLAAVTVDQLIRIDHIGSTSVPGLPAKNLIDVQVVVADFDDADHIAEASRAAGFVHVPGPLWCQDRHGIQHPEEVVVDADPGRPVNVNIRAVTAPIWRETLLFRDWLRANESARSAYLTMKRGVALRDDGNVNTYGIAKIPWISAAAEQAEECAIATDWSL